VDLARQSWVDAEPTRAQREREAMAAVAPELVWRDDLERHGHPQLKGWEGIVPIWAAQRPMPRGVPELLGDARLRVQVIYREGFPMVAPVVVPIAPDIPLAHRTQHRWHVNGDGSLCLMQAAGDWHPNETAADLVAKAAGWFIEYQLMLAERIEQMTLHGIYTCTELDDTIASYA
jgi:hypothetical protein